MTTREQATVAMLAFVNIRAKAANLRGALDALKEDISNWLDEHPDEPEILDPSTEIRAFWQEVSGGSVLNVAALDDATLRWAANQGLIDGNMKKIAACKYTVPELLAIHQNTSPGPGYRKLQVVPPPYHRRQELAEQAAQEPTGPRAVPSPPPPPQPPQPSPSPDMVCPEHGRARHSPRSGALFCPSRVGDGWCPWTSASKAS